MYMHVKGFPPGSIYYECTNCHKFYGWADRDDGTTLGDYDNWHIEEIENPRPGWPPAKV